MGNFPYRALPLIAVLALAGCLPSNPPPAPPPAPPEPVAEPTKPLDIDKVDQVVRRVSGYTPGTTIYSNVFNLSGGSCVEASTRRGVAIANALERMKDNGEIPADHTVKVYTYSGYRLPGIADASVHTYTVTQLLGPDGKPVSTWTSDDYLGPSAVTRKPGSGGYDNWNDPLTQDVTPPRLQPRGAGGGGGGGGH